MEEKPIRLSREENHKREFNTFEITNLCKPLKNGYFFVKFPTLVLSII